MRQKKFLLHALIAIFAVSIVTGLSFYSACTADNDFSTNYEFETNAARQLSEATESAGIPSYTISCGVECVYELSPLNHWQVINHLPEGVSEQDPLTPTQVMDLGIACGVPFTHAYTSFYSDTLIINSIDTLRSLAEIGQSLQHVIVGFTDGEIGKHYVIALKMTDNQSLDILDPASRNSTMQIGIIEAIIY